LAQGDRQPLPFNRLSRNHLGRAYIIRTPHFVHKNKQQEKQRWKISHVHIYIYIYMHSQMPAPMPALMPAPKAAPNTPQSAHERAARRAARRVQVLEEIQRLLEVIAQLETQVRILLDRFTADIARTRRILGPGSRSRSRSRSRGP